MLRPEVFFLRASRNNWCYFENATVNLNMHCLLVCLYFQSVSTGLLNPGFCRFWGCQKPSPYLGRLQQAFFVYTKHYQVEVIKSICGDHFQNTRKFANNDFNTIEMLFIVYRNTFLQKKCVFFFYVRSFALIYGLFKLPN